MTLAPSDAAIRVAVVCGGPGAEREISLASGHAVASALEACRLPLRVSLVDLQDATGELPPALATCDAAILAMHGGQGEDGTLQARLEEEGIPYLGSGPEASRLAMDKDASKTAMRRAGVPTPDSITVRDSKAETIERLLDDLGLPLFVKPVAEGSSVGVHRVRSRAELIAVIDELATDGRAVLVEQAVVGRELTVAVIDGVALPLVEIVTTRDFFDFEAKYRDDSTRYYLDHGLDGSQVEEIQRIALEACRVHGVTHVARVDIMHDGVTPWVLELNTLPGMTSRSLVPKAAGAAGISFVELCARFVEMTLRDRGGRGRRGEQEVA